MKITFDDIFEKGDNGLTFRLLTVEDDWGASPRATDYAINMGIRNSTYYFDQVKDGKVGVIFPNGSSDTVSPRDGGYGLMYVAQMNLKTILALVNVPNSGVVIKQEHGKVYIQFGDAPQSSCEKYARLYESLYNQGQYTETGRTFNGSKEYIIKGQKVVRTELGKWFFVEKVSWEILNAEEMPTAINSNGKGTATSIKVKPANIMIGNIPFQSYGNSGSLDFEHSDIRPAIENFTDEIVVGGIAEANRVISDVSEEEFFIEVKMPYKHIGKKSYLEMSNPYAESQNQGRETTQAEEIADLMDDHTTIELYGPPGIGKTAIVEEILGFERIVYLQMGEGMDINDIKGGNNYQTGELVIPGFAKEILSRVVENWEDEKLRDKYRLKMQYALRNLKGESLKDPDDPSKVVDYFQVADEIYDISDEDDETIGLLADEFLNAPPDVQVLLQSVVNQRIVQIGRGLRLPKNVTVILTGNQSKYSNTAKGKATIMESRGNHSVVIKVHPITWVNEYALTHGVHPLVINYIKSKYSEKVASWNKNASDAYVPDPNGEYVKNQDGKYEPKMIPSYDSIGGMDYFCQDADIKKKRQVDVHGQPEALNNPRLWTKVSENLNKFFKKLGSGTYQGLKQSVIDSKFRKCIEKLPQATRDDFYTFVMTPSLPILDVVNNSFETNEIPTSTSEKYAQVIELLKADELQFETCRNFLKNICKIGGEMLDMYDRMWVGENNFRKQIVIEIKNGNQNS